MLWVLRLVEAWPHDCLFHPFLSSAGPAKGPTGRQFGSRVVQVWPTDRLKRPLLEKRDTSPKPCHLLGFRTVWVDFGRQWQLGGACGSFTGGYGALCASKGAQERSPCLAKAMPSDSVTKSKEMDPTAGPDGTYFLIELTMEVHSNALCPEIGQGLGA